MALRRKKTPAIGVKTPFPGFTEPALATTISSVPSASAGSTKSNSMVSKSTSNEAVKVYMRRGNNWTAIYWADN
jgi:bifunctional non-homologous end joining protein LigD